MPYIERTGKKAIKEQLWQWDGVMHDPNIDGCGSPGFDVFMPLEQEDPFIPETM